MHIALNSEDLTKVRFEAAPLGEAVASLRALQAGTPIHRPWIETTKRRISETASPDTRAHLRLLTALVPRTGYLADSLTPTPERQDTFAEGLAAVAAVPLDLWQRDIATLLRAPVADHARVELERLAADLEEGIGRITAALQWYWGIAVEPFWPRLRALLLEDIDSRLAQLARGGILEIFKGLHPSVRPTPTGLEVIRDCVADDVPAPGGGLLLVPNAFIWPDTLVLNVAPFTPTLTYAPRGVGRLWESAPSCPDDPLAKLLGRTRAQILAQLDVPMTTTQLSCALDLAPATVSTHLKVMSEGGLAVALRSGREVFYRRAEVGESLLAAR